MNHSTIIDKKNNNKIFVSYSRKDVEIVRPFVSYLENVLRAKFWVDSTGIKGGNDFEDVLIEAINESEVVLFMLSDNSIESEWTKREVLYAEGEKKRIIPVVIDKGELRGWFKFHFGNIHYIDINIEQQKKQLIITLKELLGIEPSVLHPIKINDLFGFADDEDNVIVKGTWKSLKKINSGRYFAELLEGKIGVVDCYGQLVIPYQWDKIGEFHEGLAVVRDCRNEKYGYVNQEGELYIPCIWNYVSNFNEGLAIVRANNIRGYIDMKGKVVIDYPIGKMTDFSEELACVENGEGEWGYINTIGRIVIPYTWKQAMSFKEGLACVQGSNNLYGYINKLGKVVIPCMWEKAGSFGSGLAPVKSIEREEWGFINKCGDVVIPFQWASAYSFCEGLARVGENGAYGFIDPSGTLVIPRRFLEAKDFKDGLAEIKDCVNTQCSYVSKDGELM